MEEDFIDKFFTDEYYPGSKKKRRNPSIKDTAVSRKTSEEDSLKPVLKTLPNGRTLELYSSGALASALNRPLVTLRLWERKGYIPRAPYRLRSIVVDGVKKPGWRMYSKDMLDSAVESFRSRDLLDSPRIEWNQHRDLSVELLENWTKIHSEETKTN